MSAPLDRSTASSSTAHSHRTEQPPQLLRIRTDDAGGPPEALVGASPAVSSSRLSHPGSRKPGGRRQEQGKAASGGRRTADPEQREPCGHSDGGCCAGGMCDGAALFCLGGTCVPCGRLWEPACGGPDAVACRQEEGLVPDDDGVCVERTPRPERPVPRPQGTAEAVPLDRLGWAAVLRAVLCQVWWRDGCWSGVIVVRIGGCAGLFSARAPRSDGS